MKISRNLAVGFSLIELLTVLAVLGLLAGGVSVVFRDMRATGIQSSTAQVSSAASMARDRAVAANRHVRFAIVTDSSRNPEDWRFKRYAVLQQKSIDPTSAEWEVIAPFAPLPAGVFFGRNDVATPGGTTQMMERTADISVQGKDINYAYIEFLPNGAAKDASGSNIFSIAGRPAANQAVINPQNVSRIGVAQFTGRVRVERP